MKDFIKRPLAPIVVFVYNRPQHTLKTLEALSANYLADESELFIFCDGSKSNASPEDKTNIGEVRAIAKSKKWCKNVTVLESDVNKGLYNSIVTGVNAVLEKHSAIIVLEDDHVTSKYFLKFMNEGLHEYDGTEVACLSGYVYPVLSKLPETFFIKGADCWGWATWKESWELFTHDAVALRNELIATNGVREFNFNNSYPYLKMLNDKIEGKNNSWAILWYASAFLKNRLTLYPGTSLVQNIGNDGTGVHCSPSNQFDVALAERKIKVGYIDMEENKEAKKIFEQYFNTLYPKQTFYNRVKSKIKDKIKTTFFGAS